MSAAAHQTDLLIIGGGCAGLSLARELSACKYAGSVVMIEPRETYNDDRSWCFWAPDQHSLSTWVAHKWTSWAFGVAGHPIEVRSCPGYSYQYVRSKDFYEKSGFIIKQNANMTLNMGQRVTDVQKNNGRWLVSTASSQYDAKFVVDTRPPSEQRMRQSTLYQSFLGLEIELNQPLPDTHHVELMTEMRVVNGEFCFTYVLPLGPKKVLVETTFFARTPLTPQVIEQELHLLLEQRAWRSGRVIRQEYGVLPMGLPPSLEPQEPGWIRSGIGGGALRASSGYGFMRIQRWAQHCAAQLSSHAPTALNLETQGLLKHMDKVFLKVLQQQPERAPAIFQQLLGRVEPSQFIRFMDDRPKHSDLLAIINSMPAWPFIKVLATAGWRP
jgi:lycopene beta-cyclase